MIGAMYPFWAAIIACLTAQLVKPFFRYLYTKQFHWKHMFDSGGFPSSHTASFASLTLAVGLVENFNSTIFAVTLLISSVIAYDAANVRYYAGQNIKLTQQLIKDINELSNIQLTDPIYGTKVKEVLGHRWFEVLGGALWGLLIATLLFYIR
ncbi:MAG: divergent PAP2 family protein [Erysipelotrichaceae bacterium]